MENFTRKGPNNYHEHESYRDRERKKNGTIIRKIRESSLTDRMDTAINGEKKRE